MPTDPYTVLGLPPTATRSDITRAYRKLAKKYHPDLNPNDKAAEDRFKTITEAHDQLTGKSPPPLEIRPPAAGDKSYLEELEARYRAAHGIKRRRSLGEKLSGLFKRK
jgi:hypothetical protein